MVTIIFEFNDYIVSINIGIDLLFLFISHDSL